MSRGTAGHDGHKKPWSLATCPVTSCATPRAITLRADALALSPGSPGPAYRPTLPGPVATAVTLRTVAVPAVRSAGSLAPCDTSTESRTMVLPDAVSALFALMA